MSQTPLRAVAFDLYGTLVALHQPLLHRQVPRLFAVSPRNWLRLVRQALLRREYPDCTAMACAIAEELGSPQLAPQCEQLLRDEVASVRVLPGVRAVLEFLKRRGFKLGVISNLSSAHLEPLEATELAALIDAAVLSCRDGVVKPEPEAYRLLCQRLGFPPEEVLMVGDSLPNDVLAPAALGMPVAQVGGDAALASAFSLGWCRLAGPTPLAPLLAPGTVVPSPAGEATVIRLEPVGEEERGRYNLVAKVTARLRTHPREETIFFAKRYADPASARLEKLGHRLQEMCGLPSCTAVLHHEGEAVLLVSPAPGQPLVGSLEPSVVYEIGRQFAFGYVFANADLRPRNMHLDSSTCPPRLTTFDLEHLLLNLAVEVEALPQPLNPHAIDALPREQLVRRIKRRVLTPRTLPRARGEFFDVRSAPGATIAAFTQGLSDQREEVRRQRREILTLLHQEVYTPPFLIAGTRSYRRAPAAIDLEDLTTRLAEDPHQVLALLLAPR